MIDTIRDLSQELRQVLRSLARRPGWTLLAVLSLALGLGVNSAMFSLIHSVLLRDLPLRAPEEVVEIYTSDSGGFQYATSSYPDFLDLESETTAFSAVVALRLNMLAHDMGQSSSIRFVEEVSGDYFDFLGLPLTLGRGFLPEEGEGEGQAVAVLSHNLWRQHFGGDQEVVGESLRLNGVDFEVVGVAPAELGSSLPGIEAELWTPLAFADNVAESPRNERRGARSLWIKGRLARGVTLEQAQAQLDSLTAGLEEAWPETNRERRMTAVPSSEVALNPGIDGAAMGGAGALMVLVGLVLLIACSNIANLLLARSAGRRREVAIRSALGSGRLRLLRRELLESLMLGLGGGVLGLVFAQALARAVVHLKPPIPIPLNLEPSLDPMVFVFTLGLALVAGLICGLAPALSTARADLVPALKDGGEASWGRSLRRFGLRNGLVVTQVALSAVLLTCAGLFLRSLTQAQDVDPGFDARNGAAIQIALGLGGRYDEAQGIELYDRLRREAASLPGVHSAALVGNLPLGLAVRTQRMLPEGIDEEDVLRWPEIDSMTADTGYFETLGIDLVRGRDFRPEDTADAPLVVVVNEEFARRFWPEQDALGKEVRLSTEGPASQVVGVVATGRYRTLGEAARPFIYTAFRQDYSSMMTLVAVGDLPEGELLAGLRSAIDRIDSHLPLFDVTTLGEHTDFMLFPSRLAASLLTVFGILGLLLAAVGLYGVVAFSVARRTREVGVRMALGARRDQVVGMILREGLVLVAVGLAVGLTVGWMASGIFEGLLFGITPGDPVTYVLVALVLLIIAGFANLLPARRAAAAAPTEALRYRVRLVP